VADAESDPTACDSACPRGFHYHVYVGSRSGTRIFSGTMETYREGALGASLRVRPLSRWRRWLRRFVNRESLFTTEEHDG
jgi:hypothetical protein